MNIETIRVVSTESSDNPQGFIIINKADFDPEVHQAFGGDTPPEPTVPLQPAPTMAELIAARDALVQRERELDAERDRLIERDAAQAAEAARLAEQERVNEAEAQRLRDEAAALAAIQGAAPDPASMTKAQLQSALTAKGISFPAAADKAELLALLTQ
ncbi:HeH/LEM domain-containing protein [Janthinobacterium sp. LB2P10]|uniref:HeH/LEM domain-containing protein n=1 Tax=Janthinobacterium sp. LB2P10 TaxID=3424194 RepID=UPI003F262801